MHELFSKGYEEGSNHERKTVSRTMKDKEYSKELEEPPGKPKHQAPWEDVPLSLWNDWRWQLSHRLNTVEEFQQVINLTQDEIAGLSTPGRFRVDVTPYFASLIDLDDPDCPIRRQVIPTNHELKPFESEMIDSLAEEAHSPVPGLVHRYPDRVLMLVTTQCASYCRFCTRSRIVGESHAQFSSSQHEAQLAYIASNPKIRDVLLSGGDPLTMPLPILENLLARLRAIPHLEIIRIGTRVPVFLPQRVNEDLVKILKPYHPLWINIHFNHPKEITPEVSTALTTLADAGFPLGSQTVLMAGINDCPNIMMSLMHKLVKNRVRPYYIYQCDLVHGTGHFHTPIGKGIEIMEALRGHTSGYAIPTYVIDAPQGGGKVPILPNYLMSMSDSRVVVRNYEGYISTYIQPTNYYPHNAETCVYCQSVQEEKIQQGISGLLAGKNLSIVPEGWLGLHQKEEKPIAIPVEMLKDQNLAPSLKINNQTFNREGKS
jgi:lysine 2,3-aminomutase